MDYIDAATAATVTDVEDRLGFSISPRLETLERQFVLTFDVNVVDEMTQVLYNMDDTRLVSFDKDTAQLYNSENDTEIDTGDAKVSLENLDSIGKFIVTEYDRTKLMSTKNDTVIYNGLRYKRIVARMR